MTKVRKIKTHFFILTMPSNKNETSVAKANRFVNQPEYLPNLKAPPGVQNPRLGKKSSPLEVDS
jgi:hypothetical protein